MADPGADFGGYMEKLAAAEADDARYQKMLEEHEQWRQTTWSGWVVRQLQAFGSNHIKPFVNEVQIMMSDESNVSRRIFLFLITLLSILIAFSFLFAIGRIMNFVVGGDIIKEEEVIVVHEYETEEEARKAIEAEKKRKGKRQKKDD